MEWSRCREKGEKRERRKSFTEVSPKTAMLMQGAVQVEVEAMMP